jgi:hypothetical protein
LERRGLLSPCPLPPLERGRLRSSLSPYSFGEGCFARVFSSLLALQTKGVRSKKHQAALQRNGTGGKAGGSSSCFASQRLFFYFIKRRKHKIKFKKLKLFI